MAIRLYYKAILENQFSNLKEPGLSEMNSQTDAQAAIDKYMCDINKAFHSFISVKICVSTYTLNHNCTGAQNSVI